MPTEGGTRGRGKMNVAFATVTAGLPRGGRSDRIRRLARACGQELPGDNAGIPTLNVDHSCVPVVNDGKFRTDLFVTPAPWSTRPG